MSRAGDRGFAEREGVLEEDREGGFDYDTFTGRNVGFVTAAEQGRLRDARVLVIGTGGMGGAALQSLVRAGVGHFDIADFDAFDVSNLNRQVFADLDSVGVDKAQATRARMLRVNPTAEIVVHGRDWPQHLDALLARSPIVINGMDDIAAGVLLYRRAAVAGVTVIDAYTSPLPSVIVVGADAPRPESRLGYPSLGREVAALDAATCTACFEKELEYVLVHSSSVDHVELSVATELMQGRRKRMSFAPMVITTGNLMAFEAVKLILGRWPLADHRGYFFNPWSMRIERPRSAPVAWLRRALVRRFLSRLLADG